MSDFAAIEGQKKQIKVSPLARRPSRPSVRNFGVWATARRKEGRKEGTEGVRRLERIILRLSSAVTIPQYQELVITITLKIAR